VLGSTTGSLEEEEVGLAKLKSSRITFKGISYCYTADNLTILQIFRYENCGTACDHKIRGEKGGALQRPRLLYKRPTETN